MIQGKSDILTRQMRELKIVLRNLRRLKELCERYETCHEALNLVRLVDR